MNQRRVFVWGACLVAGCTAAPLQVPAQFRGEGFYWWAAVEGDAAVGVDGVTGTDIDFDDDLGYGDHEGVPGATLVGGETHQFGATFYQINVSAHNEIDRTLRFSDLVFRVNTSVESELDAVLVRGFYRWMPGTEQLRGGVVLGGQYIDLSAEASAAGIGRASAKVTWGMPVVGVAVDARPTDWLALRAGAMGIQWTIDDVEIAYFDLDASFAVSLGPLYAGLGYRYITIDGKDPDEPIEADLAFSGPTLILGVTW